VKDERTVYHDTVTEAQAYRLLNEGIEKAVEKSKSEIEKDYCRLYSVMFSNDWSGMRPIIERVLKSPEAAHLFSYQPFNLAALLTGLGYGEQISRIYQGLLKNDPLNGTAKREIIESMMFAGEYGKAIEALDSANNFSRDPRLNYNKLFSLYQLNKSEEAYRILTQLDSTTVASYRCVQAMILAKRGELKEAREIMDKDSRADHTLYGIEAGYGRKAANREANALDKKLVMPHLLLFSYIHSPKNLPFDLSATPNFVKRFKQAGVIIGTR
jgi:tetratricopeptide (TPR) repeat protein